MIYIMTHAGEGKTVSEDAVLVGTQVFRDIIDVVEVPKTGFVCVADGVGGNNAGEEASSYVLESLFDCVWENDEDIKKKLTDINTMLIDKSKEDKCLNKMATTLSGIYIKDNELNLIHIGNTRIYAMQGHYLKQLTSDHTVYNWLKSLGRIEEAEACNKNEIMNCFGGGDETLLGKLQITSINMAKTILLTSDGIHEYVTIDELEDVINSDISNEDKCNKVMDMALNAGSKDDMTVVLAYL